MTSAPHSARMTASDVASDRDHLALEARALADLAAHLALDVERGIAAGAHTRLAQQTQQLLERAVRYDTARRVAERYNAELGIDHA